MPMALGMSVAAVLVCTVAHMILHLQAAADVAAPAGRVVGLELDVLGTTVNAFLGIPFAQPPVGQQRFRRAEPIEPWNGIYQATRKPRACSQDREPDTSETNLFWLNVPVSEDCLYLNVWQPTPAPTGAAVLVWIYGGGYQFGTSSLVTYDGRYLAATEGVIVVTFNYRVSTLGFLYADTDDAPGNVGLTDQVLALQWVRDNIASFGGDPTNVTLFGQSAGATSIGYHLLNPTSWPLFSRVIVQSGAVAMDWGLDSKGEAYDKTVKVAKTLGCPTDQGMLACLRNKNGQQLVNTSVLGDTLFYPVVDNTSSLNIQSPAAAYTNGAFKKVDILLGSNEDEGLYFLVSDQAPGFSFRNTESQITREEFVEGILYAVPTLNTFAVDAAAFRYTDWKHLDQETMYRDALDSLYSDYNYYCPDVNTARAHVRYGAAAYMYRYAHLSGMSPFPAWMGVVHNAELPFVFGLPLNPDIPGFTVQERELTRRMMRHWANFAKTGNPNNAGDGAWSAFNETQGGYMVLDTKEPRMKTGPNFGNCAFWDSYIKTLMNKTEALTNKVDTQQPCSATSGVSGTHRLSVHGMNLELSLLTVIQFVALFVILPRVTAYIINDWRA